MKNAKNTLRALLASILSLLLCLSMLVGSTFAWFTDSATTGVNTIISGNLDIELYYQNAAADEFTAVSAQTKDLFVDENGKAMLWEPGAVSVCYIKTENLGSLAVKYVLSVIGKDIVVGGDGAALSKVLKTAVVDITKQEVGTYDRATAIAKATAADAKSLLTYQKKSSMEADDEAYHAMIVYYPKELGNEVDGALYNRSDIRLETELYMSLVATQYTFESDSFDNMYDQPALYPEIPLVVDFEKEFNITVADGGFLKYGSNEINVSSETVENDTVAIFKIEFVSSTASETTYDVSLVDKDGNHIALKKKVSVLMEVGKDLENVKVVHEGEELDAANYEYDAATGFVTIMTDSFSRYTITYDNNYEAVVSGNGYSLYDAIANADSGDTIILLKDVTPNSTANHNFGGDNITIDLNGHTINGRFRVAYGNNITFKNGTFKDTKNQTSLVINAIDLTLDNIKTENVGTFAQVGAGAKVTVKANSEIYSQKCGILIVQNGTTVDVYGKVVSTGTSAAIQGNGGNGYGGTVINVYDGAELSGSVIGIYQPQDGETNIFGGEISAKTAIALKNGDLNILGGTITGNGEERTPPPRNDNGISWSGAAVQIETNKTYPGEINLLIEGGDIISENTYAIYEYIDAASPQDKTNLKSIAITGGTLSSGEGREQIMLSTPGRDLLQ